MPNRTHLNKQISFVDDYATNGRPDTMKILPAVRKQLNDAIAAQVENPTLERASLITWLRGKVAQYSERARARKS